MFFLYFLKVEKAERALSLLFVLNGLFGAVVSGHCKGGL